MIHIVAWMLRFSHKFKSNRRFKLALISTGHIHPIILPSKILVAPCYVCNLHITEYHSGPNAHMSLICYGFWIINTRNLCHRFVKSFRQYFPHHSVQQIMENGPIERFKHGRQFSGFDVPPKVIDKIEYWTLISSIKQIFFFLKWLHLNFNHIFVISAKSLIGSWE